MLRRIIAKYGNDLCGDARRCEGLLKDLCGEYRREISVLTNAIEERIPLDLLAAGSSVPRDLLLNKLAKRLEDNLGLTLEAAHWSVNSWAIALGVIKENEVAAKEKNQSSGSPRIPPVIPASQKPEIQKPIQKPAQKPIQNRQSQSAQRSMQPLPQPTPNIYVPTSTPKSSAQSGGLTVNAPQNLPHTGDPTLQPAPRKWFRRFSGCLFVFFLLIVTSLVLVFGVPYAISVMRETQQSQPPRFPPQ